MTNIKISKMPFEKHSYIITAEEKTSKNYINEQWINMKKWLGENDVSYSISGNIIRFSNEHEESFFLIKYLDGS